MIANRRDFEGYYSFDLQQADAWTRFFCAELPDKTCGLLLVQHHFRGDFPFDTAKEANIGMISAGSLDNAFAGIRLGNTNEVVYPAVIRRLSRLLTNGGLIEEVKNTVAERGLERAVAYSPDEKNLTLFERAGFEKTVRDGQDFYLLDV